MAAATVEFFGQIYRSELAVGAGALDAAGSHSNVATLDAGKSY
jgi:hypothetical protein